MNNINNIFLKQIKNNQIKFTDADIRLWDNWMQYVISNYPAGESKIMIWTSLKNNLYNEKIIVNTITNEKYILPIGSSAIDLAFHISEKIGLSVITCKINGTVKSLFTELKNTDIVEIITSPSCEPDFSWLDYVISFKSIAYLTNYFKNKYQKKSKNLIKFIRKYYQKIIIVGKQNDSLLLSVQTIIGKHNINKLTFANNANNFIIAVYTNIETTTCTNQMFLDLIKVKGIKQINMQYYF